MLGDTLRIPPTGGEFITIITEQVADVVRRDDVPTMDSENVYVPPADKYPGTITR